MPANEGEFVVDWQEVYAGGSAEAERRLIQQWAQDMLAIQRRVARKTNKPGHRTLHAKIIAGFDNARLLVDDALPTDLSTGYFQAGRQFPVTLRLSNASPVCAGDGLPDMRGAAVRIHFNNDDHHDLLMTSFPASHARNAKQFVEVARIATGKQWLIVPRLILTQGFAEALRIIRNVRTGSRPCNSVATLQFWSRAPLLWGDGGPVRYSLRPVASDINGASIGTDPDYLEAELASRLAEGDVVYRLAVQRYVDDARTPIENGAAHWRESDSPMIDIATLTIPRQDALGARGVAMKRAVNALPFNPWNCPRPFRPLGSLNRARGRVYATSAEGWLGAPPPRPKRDDA